MNSDIDPDDAIEKIIAFSNQIDAIYQMDYTQGGKTKSLLETRIKNFVGATFKDGDKKLQDLDKNRYSHTIHVFSKDEEELVRQKNYEADLEVFSNHLIAYKDELELRNGSRKKKNQTSLSKTTIKENEPSYAQIRVYGIVGIIIAVVTGTSTINTYPNLSSFALFGVLTLIFGGLGIGCLVKPDSFGETLFLLLKQLGGKSESPNNSNIQQKQKNPKNSPQIVNYGQLNYGTKPDQSDEDKE